MNREESPWWFDLTDGQRHQLDESARRSILRLSRYPYWDQSMCVELLAWAQIAGDVLEAHQAWLTATRQRAERTGRAWTQRELLRQSRLAGDLTTPPPWLTGEAP